MPARPSTRIMPGARFGRLTVIEREVTQGVQTGNQRWKCRCECGADKLVAGPNLLSGATKSCGCLKRQYQENRRKVKVIRDGYAFLLIPEHPRANRHTGRVREHIVVMEGSLGRPLLPGEEVHHLNAIGHDNRLENLELWNRSQPAGARVADQVNWAREILERYEPEALASLSIRPII